MFCSFSNSNWIMVDMRYKIIWIKKLKIYLTQLCETFLGGSLYFYLIFAFGACTILSHIIMGDWSSVLNNDAMPACFYFFIIPSYNVSFFSYYIIYKIYIYQLMSLDYIEHLISLSEYTRLWCWNNANQPSIESSKKRWDICHQQKLGTAKKYPENCQI